MGDPFSIAVGALQVAEVGFKLCDTLHSSVRNFKNAEKDVKRVAGEVKTASWALKQLGALLQQDEAIKRTKPGAISEASTALDQCSEAFAEVQIILPAVGSDSTASISAATRFKWATRKSKVDALLANLEVLVFKVISYAKEIASSPKDSATDQMDMRFQLETLIKSKDEAVRRYEELVKSLNQTRLDDDSTNAFGPDLESQSLNAGLNLMALPSNHAPPAQGNTNVKSTAPETNTGDKDCENLDLTKGLTEALADCHKAASALSECLHIVQIQWRAVKKYDGDDIWEKYRLTRKAMRALEIVQDVSPETTPSLTTAQMQALQQQAQEQVETIVQQKMRPRVPELPLAQIQGQGAIIPRRSPSSARGRSGSCNAASDQEDHILDLANPERTPSHDNSKREQKHPATFQCHLCPKRFTRPYNLRSHLRTHTDERPFKCTVCGKAFARQHDRRRHEGLHSGENKFVCKGNLESGAVWGCGRRFARADALYRHFCSEAGRVCIGPLQEEEERAYRQSLGEEDATTQTRPHTGGLGLDTGIGEVEKASLKTDRELPGIPKVLLQQYPALARIHLSALHTPLSPSKDEARDHDANIEHDGDERATGGLSGVAAAFGVDYLFVERAPHPGRQRREIGRSDDEDPRESSAHHEDPPTINEYEDRDSEPSVSAASREGSWDSDDSYDQDDHFERGIPVRLQDFSWQDDNDDDDSFDADLENANKTSSSRDDKFLSQKGAPSANDDLKIGPSQEKIVDPPLTPSDMDSQDTEDPVDALLREWTTVQVC